MSSFNNPHYFYLFEMRNGKKKLAYGASPEDAFAILKLRLTPAETEQILQDQYTKIPQRKLRQYIQELG
jgi:hypothetical protein